MENIFVVSSPVQAVLFERELKGQLSDGFWENTRPSDHWRTWCRAKVVVGPSVGRTFTVIKDNYNLSHPELLEAVGGRMLGYARLFLAFGEEGLNGLDSLIGSDGWVGLPSDWALKPYIDSAPGGYWDTVRTKVTETLARLGVTLEQVAAVAKAENVYNLKHLRKDLREIKAAMKTTIFPVSPVPGRLAN